MDAPSETVALFFQEGVRASVKELYLLGLRGTAARTSHMAENSRACGQWRCANVVRPLGARRRH
jgi:hypothetical protein